METITIPKQEYELMKREIETLRNTALYKRVLEFEQNIAEKKLTRKDICL
jgi:PHD/YefM family antitoxin component YafN of YafNO toxin-antitoxin module